MRIKNYDPFYTLLLQNLHWQVYPNENSYQVFQRVSLFIFSSLLYFNECEKRLTRKSGKDSVKVELLFC